MVERLVIVGDSVKAGQVVANLDPENERNGLRSAQAAVAAAAGQLAEASNNYNRQRELLAGGWTTKAMYDQAVQQQRTAQAQLDAAHAQTSIAEDRWVPDAKCDGQPYEVEGFRDRDGKAMLPFDPPDQAVLDAAWPDGAIWPRELQAPDSFMCKGRITNFDFYPEFREGDFFDFKKLNLSVDWSGTYPSPSPTLRRLIYCYEYWIAYADIDGFRIDAVKHMGQESTRIFCAAIHEFTQSLGKEHFFLAG